MSIITKWMLQEIALFMLGWMATVTASWSNNVASGTGNDRLAELSAGVLSSPAVTVATSRNLQSE
ncbi:hypothetical protein ALQ72_01449 [Pseudomonas syringae pv. maculicola]|uniref:Uncharacterized protein n=1 Tax=Pseudomonas syringae pv. maculicola TaxID=59511 RepID=A0A0N0FZE4_PSEYM|nr:hypothetical protein [Pseudomonas syringae group genomosp. 3]KPB95426.1 Uncharacterized protein AC503_1354 [Pseudomonas syringae pv. maculicola]MBM0211314.1 hypothetical protein [Pseudomonas syringae pv. maculicola]RMM80838.1 hypothetical protein ALQ72_01449 [Pseudomonas syringae pv. maculicola]RMV34960.1 hypothetical protein ALP13_00665 [Pseudomonas syringae pv. maculicola]